MEATRQTTGLTLKTVWQVLSLADACFLLRCFFFCKVLVVNCDAQLEMTDSSATYASVMQEWGSHTQPQPAFCKMGGVRLLPSLENFVEGKHWCVSTSEWQWPKWDVVQDLTCSRQRTCRLGLNVLGSPAFPLCSSTASLVWGLQTYNLLRVCEMQFPRYWRKKKSAQE